MFTTPNTVSSKDADINQLYSYYVPTKIIRIFVSLFKPITASSVLDCDWADMNKNEITGHVVVTV